MIYKKIRPENGYCFFFPARKPGGRFVSGQSTRVFFWEEWKHVKLGIFYVDLPSEQLPMLITTSELLECTVKANFGIVIGGPEDGREERLKKATLSCPAHRSLNADKRVELVPFFRDWAANYCRTAIINKVKEREYIRLIEEADYRTQAEKSIEDFARTTLAEIGMMLVQCTVIVEPKPPTGIFATPDIISKWEVHNKTVNEAEISRIKLDNAHSQEKQQAQSEHSRKSLEITENERLSNETIKQGTDISLKNLASDLKMEDNKIAIQEKLRESDKDRQITEIQKQMDDRAHGTQKMRIQREGELEQETERKLNEQASLKIKHESEQLEQRQKLLISQKVEAEKKLELLALQEKVDYAAIELDRLRGQVNADNIEKEILANGSHEAKMRELFLTALPAMIENASRPIEKIGEIRLINLSGGLGLNGDNTSNIGSLLATASTLPVIREYMKIFTDIEKSEK